MKKHINAILISLCFILSITAPITTFAADYTDDADYAEYVSYVNDNEYNDYSQYDYIIRSYNIDITVNKDNTLSVTEDITAFFNTPKHGIYRYIPIVNRIKQSDGSYKKVNCSVSNVKAEGLYDKYTDGDNYVIQIGDPDQRLSGLKDYTISYTFSMGRDTNDGFDALYYNLIGTGWDTCINGVTFSITMPDDNFSKDKLSFYLGEYGSNTGDSIEYNVNNNVITGKVYKTLYPGEALTATLILDDGYFTFNYSSYYAQLIFTVAVPLIALLAVLFLWTKHGRDKKIVDVVEFYPPEGLNSAEVALWYNGKLSREDTIGLLIELANEGYIEITEKEKGKVFKSTELEIRKIKNEYTGSDDMKRQFFSGLFKSGDCVSPDDLEDEFYNTIDGVIGLAAGSQEKVFNKKSLALRAIGWIISILSIFISLKIAGIGLTDRGNAIAGAVGVLIGIIAFVMSFFIRQRSDMGHELKQKINGFKIFLETAEKEKLETLVESDPSYFYDILPFAYVLGVSDKWIKNFEGITLERPHWYCGNTFSPMTMYYLMHNQMPNVTRSMISIPQSSSGSGLSGGGGLSSGGGGFSGGGFGGGGGGSW